MHGIIGIDVASQSVVRNDLSEQVGVCFSSKGFVLEPPEGWVTEMKYLSVLNTEACEVHFFDVHLYPTEPS